MKITSICIGLFVLLYAVVSVHAAAWKVDTPTAMHYGSLYSLKFTPDVDITPTSVNFISESSGDFYMKNADILTPNLMTGSQSPYGGPLELLCYASDESDIVVGQMRHVNSVLTLTLRTDIEANQTVVCKFRASAPYISKPAQYLSTALVFSVDYTSSSTHSITGETGKFTIPIPTVQNLSPSAIVSAKFVQGSEKIKGLFDISSIEVSYGELPSNSMFLVNFISIKFGSYDDSENLEQYINEVLPLLTLSANAYSCSSGVRIFNTKNTNNENAFFIVTSNAPTPNGKCKVPFSKFPFGLLATALEMTQPAAAISDITIDLNISNLPLSVNIGKPSKAVNYGEFNSEDISSHMITTYSGFTAGSSVTMELVSISAGFTVDEWRKNTIVLWINDYRKFLKALADLQSKMSLAIPAVTLNALATDPALADSLMKLAVNAVLRQAYETSGKITPQQTFDFIDNDTYEMAKPFVGAMGLSLQKMSKLNPKFSLGSIKNNLVMVSFFTKYSENESDPLPPHTLYWDINGGQKKALHYTPKVSLLDYDLITLHNTALSVQIKINVESSGSVFDTSSIYPIDQYISVIFGAEIRNNPFPVCTATSSAASIMNVTILPPPVDHFDNYTFSLIHLEGNVQLTNDLVTLTCDYSLTPKAKPSLFADTSYISIKVIDATADDSEGEGDFKMLPFSQYTELVPVEGEDAWVLAETKTSNVVIYAYGPAITTETEYTTFVEKVVSLLPIMVTNDEVSPLIDITGDFLLSPVLESSFSSTRLAFKGSSPGVLDLSFTTPQYSLSNYTATDISALIFLIDPSIEISSSTYFTMLKQDGYTIAVDVLSDSHKGVALSGVAKWATALATDYSPAFGRVPTGGPCFSTAQCHGYDICYSGLCNDKDSLSTSNKIFANIFTHVDGTYDQLTTNTAYDIIINDGVSGSSSESNDNMAMTQSLSFALVLSIIVLILA